VGNVHRIHGGKDCIEGSRFDCLPERLTPFYDGFRKVGLPLPKLATGFELRIFPMRQGVPSIYSNDHCIAPCELNTLVEL
jgi:hypothetical protein